MDEVPRLILMLVLAGVVLTLLGAIAVRFNDEARRIRRGLKKVLGAEPHAVIVARGRGRGAGFDFGANRMAVAWDAGGWCLIYRIDELLGAELILDGQVAARAYRGEDRRALDLIGGAEKEVRLRLIFDDPRHPDFDLPLWVEADAGRRGAQSAEDAVQEANRWIARTEAILRRPPPRREPVAVAPPSPAAEEAVLEEEAPDEEDAGAEPEEDAAEIDLESGEASDAPPPWADDADDEDHDANRDERIA
jgi:hypothetical protein